jgi:hypothetical protein
VLFLKNEIALYHEAGCRIHSTEEELFAQLTPLSEE